MTGDDDFWSADDATVAAPPQLAPVACQHIADDEHVGLRWYVQQFADREHRTVTVSGFVGPRYVYAEQDFATPTPASVRRWCEALAAEPVAKRERR